MTWLDKAKQRAAVKLIASARVFGLHHSCAFSHHRTRGRGRSSEKTPMEQSLGAIRLRGDQLTGRFCVLTLMECKQRWVLQWWRRSTQNNEENKRGTKYKKNCSSRHLEYLQHELITAWHRSGHSGPVLYCFKEISWPEWMNKSLKIPHVHFQIVSTDKCIKRTVVCKHSHTLLTIRYKCTSWALKKEKKNYSAAKVNYRPFISTVTRK